MPAMRRLLAPVAALATLVLAVAWARGLERSLRRGQGEVLRMVDATQAGVSELAVGTGRATGRLERRVVALESYVLCELFAAREADAEDVTT